MLVLKYTGYERTFGFAADQGMIRSQAGRVWVLYHTSHRQFRDINDDSIDREFLDCSNLLMNKKESLVYGLCLSIPFLIIIRMT